MRTNVIRLYEHINLLQNGVEISRKSRLVENNVESLKRGLNGERVRIGLMGATSAGKTTLIQRLLGDSAGKISSKPETACLVVHKFGESENLVFWMKEKVAFKTPDVSSRFQSFIKKYKLDDYYTDDSECEWRLRDKKDNQGSNEYSREKIFDFFQEVNAFDGVFERIEWNHKKRRRSYDLVDLIDVYDFPGFGGKDEHDQVVSDTLGMGQFEIDFLIYVIDTSKGIPAEDEKCALEAVQRFLLSSRSSGRSTQLYWAYEKPVPEGVNAEEAIVQISDAISKLGLSLDGKFIDLAGNDDEEGNDMLRERVLVGILRDYYVDRGSEYLDGVYKAKRMRDELARGGCGNLFNENCEPWNVVQSILHEIYADGMKSDVDVNGAAKKILRRLGVEDIEDSEVLAEMKSVDVGGRLKGLFNKLCNSGVGKKDDATVGVKASDREFAVRDMKRRVVNSVCRIVCGISKDGKIMSDRTKEEWFKKNVYDKDTDIRMLVFDTQFYLMLSKFEGVRGYIMEEVEQHLRENIKREIREIKEFKIDDED